MKAKLIAALAGAMMMAIPGAAHAMDCCEDDKCACCALKDETPAAPNDDHQH